MNTIIASTPGTVAARVAAALDGLNQAACHLTPEDIVAQGRYLGAGLAGGSYEISFGGQALVAKQWGHPEAVLSKFSPWTGRELQVQAAKQVAVQNALVLAGVPAPVSVVLAPGSAWVLMEKKEGLQRESLTSTQAEAADALISALEAQATPVAESVLEGLKAIYPDTPHLLHCAIDVSNNTLFEQTADGLRVSGTYDPLI